MTCTKAISLHVSAGKLFPTGDNLWNVKCGFDSRLGPGVVYVYVCVNFYWIHALIRHFIDYEFV